LQQKAGIKHFFTLRFGWYHKNTNERKRGKNRSRTEQNFNL